jgi:tRNA modification GTPase
VEQENDTIVAIATPPGRGGIGIVRLSGARAREIAEGMVRLRRPLAAGRARFAQVLDAAQQGTKGDDAVLDEAVVTYFAAPHSYTSEDVVEIAAHGAPVLLDALLRHCCARGARLAEPGEFTQRAFLSGRLDLTQAEAVQDLIESTTLAQVRRAARQLGGAVSAAVQPVKEALIALIAGLEAGIDFAEDDLDLLPEATIARRIAEIREPLARLEETFAYGRVLRHGFSLALVGRPNAGKSSLFNRLVRSERAIVTAQPGTTRDLVRETLEFDGVPVELVDTAGLRTAVDEAEAQGIARSRQAMAEADVLLVVVAANEAVGGEDLEALRATGGQGNRILVLNKMDLSPEPSVAWRSLMEHGLGDVAMLRTCALSGDGLAALREAIAGRLHARPGGADSAMLTNLRQHGAVKAALAAVDAAGDAARLRTPHEMLLLDLYEALHELDVLTGRTTPDDVLNLIFATFCIGK